MKELDFSLIKSKFNIPDKSIYMGCYIYNYETFEFLHSAEIKSFGKVIGWSPLAFCGMNFDNTKKAVEYIIKLNLQSKCSPAFLFDGNGHFYLALLSENEYKNFI